MKELTRSAGQAPERPEILGRNLVALERRQPELAARLAHGASEDHVVRAPDGRTLLLWRGAGHALDLEGPAEAGVECALERPAAGTSGETLLFGLGLGETLARALVSGPAPVLAWERDPALLLATLSRLDVAAALDTGRLRFALGTDLLARTGARRPARMLAHPLLGSVYQRERRLVERGPVGPLIALAEGRLFVDQVGDCLERLGWQPFTLDLRMLTLEELDHQLRALAPRFLFEINHLPGSPEFCAERAIPYVTWEIDPSTESLPPLARPASAARVFTYRRAHVEEFRRAGFERVEYTPLAADVETRSPVEFGGGEGLAYAADVAFVGASMVERGKACRRDFLALVAQWAERSGVAAGDADAALEELLADQRRTPFEYRVPELLEAHFGAFMADHSRRREQGATLVRPDSLVGEVAAAEKRLGLLAGLARFSPQVWGDEGWRMLEAHGVRHRGGAGHRLELNRVYSGARINLDIGRIYQSDIVTMRVFDVLACGGFALVEHNEALEELFEVGVELESYRDLDELAAKVEYYLAHEDRRRAIAERGLAAVRERHSMQARLAAMLAELEAPAAVRDELRADEVGSDSGAPAVDQRGNESGHSGHSGGSGGSGGRATYF
jgi:spore maturation protein CgeB